MSFKTKSLLLAVALIITTMVAILFGTVDITVSECIKIIGGHIPGIKRFVDLAEVKNSHIVIVMGLRLPRILLALFVGMGLATAGSVYQGVFSNPMADPYLIGISSGAALGATIAMFFSTGITLFNISAVNIFAFLGALLVMALVYAMSYVKGKLPTVTLILSGIAMNYLITSIITLLMLLNHRQIERVYFWTLGSFQSAKWYEVGLVAVVVIIGIVIIQCYSKELNIIMVDRENARTLGVNVERVKKILLIVASIMVAIIVSVSGIIGFVGLIIPHSARFIVGPDHRKLIPFATVLGGLFMIVTDTIARSILKTSEISVGVVTALFGVPFFLMLLYKNKKATA